MSVTGVVHPVITTTDLDDALCYFRDLFGMRVSVDVEHDQAKLSALMGSPTAARMAVVTAPDGSEIELVQFDEAPASATRGRGWSQPGPSSVTLRTMDLDRLLDRLAAAGYPALSPVVDYRLPGLAPVRVAYVTGPDQIVLTLVEEQAEV